MSWLKDLIALTLIIGTLFGTTLGRYPLAAPDGARYAEIPREMVATGDYLTPHLNYVKYFEKPPLFYWLQAASIKAFGATDLAVSIVNALMALGCCLLLYFTARKLGQRLHGIIASLILATTSLVFALTRTITLDMTFTFFCTGGLCFFLIASQLPLGIKRSWYLWTMYIFIALAVMTKGLIGIVIPGIIILSYTAVLREWHKLKTYHYISGFFIFCLITLPWHILVHLKNPEFSYFYFIEQHFLRYFTNYAGRSQQWWFLPVMLLGGLYPWTVFLPQAIRHNMQKNWRHHKPTIFLLLWPLVIYIFYTFSNSKLIPYILPMFPPLALLLSNYFAAFWYNKSTRLSGFNAFFICNLGLSIGAIKAIFILNFNNETITKQNLYIVAIWLFISAIMVIISYRRRGLPLGFTVLIITTSALWLYLSPIITIINKHSIKPLITTLQKTLTPTDEVICYGAYYQDLPFYLQRRITVANYAGELTFGMEHQNTKAWMIDSKTLQQRWQSKKRVYLITRINEYHHLAPTLGKGQIIAKYLDDVLVVNNL